MFEQLIREIGNFAQFEQESLFEAWEWFNRLQRSWPHHGYPPQRLVHFFYGGLSQHNWLCLDATVGENLMHKLTDAIVDIIEAMDSNAYNPAVSKEFSGDSLGFIRWKLIHLVLLLNKRWICWPSKYRLWWRLRCRWWHSCPHLLSMRSVGMTCGWRLSIHSSLGGSELCLWKEYWLWPLL